MNKEFVKNLIRANGLSRSLQIAEGRVRASDPSNWSALPVGPVFYSKDRKGQLSLDVKGLTKTNNQWKDVRGRLQKIAKGEK